MNESSLSVLLSNYNHARYLPAALEAILGQSHRPLEFIIIDDGSTDGSVGILERYRDRAPDLIRLITLERNGGVVAAQQRLVAMARGDYVYFAASDDLVLPGFFEKSMRLLREHPQAALCTTLARVIDVNGRDTGYLSAGAFPSVNAGYASPTECRRDLMQRDFCIIGASTIYHRVRLLQAGGHRAELGPFSDGFLAQTLALRHGACVINEPLVAGRWTGTNYSQVMSNPDTGLAVHDGALNLMREELADLFPSEYVELWKSRSYFNNARYLVRGTQRDFQEGVARLASRADGVDSLALRAVSHGMSFFAAAALILLGAVIKRRDIPRWLGANVKRYVRFGRN